MSNIYGKYMPQVIKRQYKNYVPSTGEAYLNSTSKRIDFKIDYGDLFAGYGWEYSLKASIVKTTDGSDYKPTNKLKLVDNFVPFAFSRIELKLNNQIIDEVDYPGITSTIKSLVSYNQSAKHTLRNSGFYTDAGALSLHVTGKLSQLGLGFCDTLQPLPKGQVTLTFIRASDNDALFKETDASTADNCKLIISDFIIRVPLLDYDPLAKMELVKELVNQKQCRYWFLKWQTIQKSGVFGSTWNFDITNLYRGSGVPMFVIICFQTNRDDVITANASEFDHCGVKNFKVKVNDHYYPEEAQLLSFENKKCSIAYEMYKDFRIAQYHDSHVILDPKEFIASPMFVVDTTDHPQPLTYSQTNIQVTVDFEKPITTSGVSAYITLVSKSQFDYDILSSNVSFAP